jgi:hypothetical protein
MVPIGNLPIRVVMATLSMTCFLPIANKERGFDSTIILFHLRYQVNDDKTEEECYRYVQEKYSYSEYFADYFCCLKSCYFIFILNLTTTYIGINIVQGN